MSKPSINDSVSSNYRNSKETNYQFGGRAATLLGLLGRWKKLHDLYGDDVKRMETMFGFSSPVSIYRCSIVPPSGDDSAGSISITIGGIGPRAYYRGCFPRRVIRPGGDGRKCDRSDRAVRLRVNGCRSGKYREAESSPSLRSIAVAAIARDPTRFLASCAVDALVHGGTAKTRVGFTDVTR